MFGFRRSALFDAPAWSDWRHFCPQDLRPEFALARLEMGAHPCMEATLVQERLPFDFTSPWADVIRAENPPARFSQIPTAMRWGVSPIPPVRRFAARFVTFATALAAATRR